MLLYTGRKGRKRERENGEKEMRCAVADLNFRPHALNHAVDLIHFFIFIPYPASAIPLAKVLALARRAMLSSVVIRSSSLLAWQSGQGKSAANSLYSLSSQVESKFYRVD